MIDLNLVSFDSLAARMPPPNCCNWWAGVLAMVVASPLSKSRALAEMGVPRRTYCDWVRREKESNTRGVKIESRRPWNKVKVEAEKLVIVQARMSPELSSRQLALRQIDKYDCWVSESTVYRILRREGLVKRAEVKGFAAGKEYHWKTRGPNQMWATDCSYLRVVGWGFYYLVTATDDYSRYILGWELKRDMTANSLIDVVQPGS